MAPTVRAPRGEGPQSSKVRSTLNSTPARGSRSISASPIATAEVTYRGLCPDCRP